MHFVTLILSLLATQIQAISPLANNVQGMLGNGDLTPSAAPPQAIFPTANNPLGISTNESLTLYAAQLQAQTPPAKEVPGNSGDENFTLYAAQSQALSPRAPPGNIVHGRSRNKAPTSPMVSRNLNLHDRRQSGSSGAVGEIMRECHNVVARWPLVSWLFWPRSTVRVDIVAAQRENYGFLWHFNEGNDVMTQTRVLLWNPATGTIGVIVAGWNRTRRPQVMTIVVEVVPQAGSTRTRTQDYRQTLNLRVGYNYADEACMITTFGKNVGIKMTLWIEDRR